MDLLQRLVNALGPSGNEMQIRSVISHEIKPFVDEIKVDKMGNLICRKKGKGPKVMLAAHMDEIGLMVRAISDQGQISFSMIGGVEPSILPQQRVQVMNRENKVVCTGIITFIELHEGSPLDSSPPTIDDLYVDCGLDKKGLEKLGVDVGCYLVPHGELTMLGDKKLVCGKALDNRSGCYTLIKLAQRLKHTNKNDLYYVFTVQEEVGLYGAQTSVYTINPDWAIAVDTTSAEDSEEPYYTRLGKGPCISAMDVELITNRCLNDHLRALSKKHRIPLQMKVERYGTTDATKLMLSHGGVPCTVVAVPLRNIHSTITIAHMDDIGHTIDLLEKLLKDPPKVCLV